MNKPSDNLGCLIVSMVGYFRAFVFQHKVLEMRRPSLACVSLMAPGPSRQRAGLTATGFYTGAPSSSACLEPPTCFPAHQRNRCSNTSHIFFICHNICILHFAIVVDEYFKYSACLPPTNLQARFVPTNKTGATSNATKTVSSPKSQYLVETSIFFVFVNYTLA